MAHEQSTQLREYSVLRDAITKDDDDGTKKQTFYCIVSGMRYLYIILFCKMILKFLPVTSQNVKWTINFIVSNKTESSIKLEWVRA